MNQENKVIHSWRLKLGMLMAIILPTVAATGSFYSLKLEAKDHESKMNDRVGALELNSEKTFADKTDLKDIRDDVKELRNQVSEIKTMLIRQSKD